MFFRCSCIINRPVQESRRQRITNLKTFVRAAAFVQQYGIADLDGLRDKVVDMYAQVGDVSDRLKKWSAV